MHWPCAVLIAALRVQHNDVRRHGRGEPIDERPPPQQLDLALPRRGRRTSDHGRRFFSTPPRPTRRLNMRALFVPALVAVGIALAGTSPTLAAPAIGVAIANAAGFNQGIEPVYWRNYHYRYHWRWHRYGRWW